MFNVTPDAAEQLLKRSRQSVAGSSDESVQSVRKLSTLLGGVWPDFGEDDDGDGDGDDDGHGRRVIQKKKLKTEREREREREMRS